MHGPRKLGPYKKDQASYFLVPEYGPSNPISKSLILTATATAPEGKQEQEKTNEEYLVS